MAWLTRSIADTLRLDGDEEAAASAAAEELKKPAGDAAPKHSPNNTELREDRPRDSPSSVGDRRLSDSDGGASYIYGGEEDSDGDYRGVQEDLSEFRESITRQFRGVASFLAPPPPPPPPLPPPLYHRSGIESKPDRVSSVNADEEGEEEDESAEYYARESDQFGKSSNLSPLEDYDEDDLEKAIGITEEVLAFARNIAHHPETWLDFPIEEEEFDDFDISNSQYKHALAVEQLAPRLAALRYELCPIHMRLVKARAMWFQELQKQAKGDSYWSGISTFQSKTTTDFPHENIVSSYIDVQLVNDLDWRSTSESSTNQMTAEHEIEKHVLDELEFIDKPVIKEDPPPKLVQDKEIAVGSSDQMPFPNDDDDDEDAWVKDDSDLIGYTSTSVFVNEDDISFSDLEDDFDSNTLNKFKPSSTEMNREAKTT